MRILKLCQLEGREGVLRVFFALDHWDCLALRESSQQPDKPNEISMKRAKFFKAERNVSKLITHPKAMFVKYETFNFCHIVSIFFGVLKELLKINYKNKLLSSSAGSKEKEIEEKFALPKWCFLESSIRGHHYSLISNSICGVKIQIWCEIFRSARLFQSVIWKRTNSQAYACTYIFIITNLK